MSKLKTIAESLRSVAVVEERGQAILEFLIVFPLQLLFVMGIMQLSLIYIGHQVLNYAAFTACRAALVGDLSDDGGRQDAYRAAAMVMSSVAGESGVRGGRDVEVPGWGDLTRGKAAMKKTKIVSLDEEDGVVHVVVEHEYELAIPVVNRLFAYPWEGFMGSEESRNTPDVRASRKYGWPHLVIHEECYLYRPWAPGDGRPNSWVPGVPGLSGLFP